MKKQHNFQFVIQARIRYYLFRELSGTDAVDFNLRRGDGSVAWEQLFFQAIFIPEGEEEPKPVDFDYLNKEMPLADYAEIQNSIIKTMQSIRVEGDSLAAEPGYEFLLPSPVVVLDRKLIMAGGFARIQDALVKKNIRAIESIIQSFYGVSVEALGFWGTCAVLEDLSQQITPPSGGNEIKIVPYPMAKK